MAARWSASGTTRGGRGATPGAPGRPGGPGEVRGVGGRPPRRGRLLLGLGVVVLAAALAPAAAAVPEPSATPGPAHAVTSLPAATLPPADASQASITALPLASRGRDGEGTQVARSAGPLQLVAVTWTGPTPDAVALRSTDAAGRWGAWMPLDSEAGERDGAPARAAGGGTDPVWVGDRRQ